MNFGTFINKLHSRLQPYASPHYYHGRSVSKLLLNNLLLFLFMFILAKRPSRDLIEPTSKLKNTKIGKTALVLGNGPSVDDVNINAVEKFVDDIYCVNDFFNLEIAKELKCNNYILSDPMSFSDETETSPKEFLTLFTQSGGRVFLPHWSSRVFPTFFSGIRPFYFDDRERIWFNRKISPVKPRNYTSVTLYKALAIACYQGYSIIYVLGLDNTEFKSYEGSHDNVIYHNQKTYGAQSKFHKPLSMQGVFQSGMAGRMQSYSHLFGDLKKFKNCNIVNLDQRSLTDVFPKIDVAHELSVSCSVDFNSNKERG
jgi:hypothetical protein